MTTTYTQKLLRAAKAGQTVVCAIAPYEGQRVTYDPGYDTGYRSTHPAPWVLLGTDLRFNGRDCRIAEPPIL